MEAGRTTPWAECAGVFLAAIRRPSRAASGLAWLLAMALPAVVAGGETLTRKADSFYTPVHMNRGDLLRFTLANGQVRNVEVVDCGIDTRKVGGLQWTLWADVRIDGHLLRLVYSPFDMKALSPPKVVNGMRLGLDGVKGLPEAVGWAEKKTGQHPAANPPADVRLWVNDASMPLLPNVHCWFDLAQHLGKAVDNLTPGDYALRQDRDIHPASSRLAGNQKTGWLGGWTYGVHCGLDLQLKVGTRLFCVTDSGIWRGYDAPDGTGQNSDSLHYVVVRDNGQEWWFGNAHCDRVEAVKDKPMKAGTVYALSGRKRAGIPHAHASVRIRREGRWEYALNPWPIMWQGLRNQQAAAGLPCPEIAPLAPARAGQKIQFCAESPRRDGGSDKVQYHWLFDDGTSLTGRQVAKSFDRTGLHQAILIVHDANGADLAEQFVAVGPGGGKREPWVSRGIYAMPPRISAGAKVTFGVEANDESPNTLRYSWDFGDGVKTDGEGADAKAQDRSLEHTYAKPGRYYVIVTVTANESALSRLDWYALDVE